MGGFISPLSGEAAGLTEPGSFYLYDRERRRRDGSCHSAGPRVRFTELGHGGSPSKSGPVSAKGIFSELASNSNQAVPVQASEALLLISTQLDGGRETKRSAITFLSLSSLTVTARNLGSDPV
jgi:hypothetical protein